jgi:hypothetical protein
MRWSDTEVLFLFERATAAAERARALSTTLGTVRGTSEPPKAQHPAPHRADGEEVRDAPDSGKHSR